ncbi:hypothetical protein DR950_03860 [Kitasatospora xanthocidica]|uniref:Uncharacterized protein n=1 Tax=Kitasatospora xanthocidica TaxID=83382 RepID=A0A372ZMU1_9ACTN|nr:hypothetical protein [Kitasatospora xanthocidica]RGD57041.1 hypothetical protein DR950_03860 [Kitasatospora xanthocidica]
MPTAPITPGDFPTSPLALRFADPARQAKARAFASEQAAAATEAADLLAQLWDNAPGRPARAAALAAVHERLVDWRYRLAVAMGPPPGPAGAFFNPERFRTPIREGDTNFDRLGEVGRLREGAEWDQATRTYTGGRATPASEAMLRYGRLAERRFAAEGVEGDTLQNWVLLPDGRRIAGNRLLRGEAAYRADAELVARYAARGLDASRIETGGRPVYSATPTPRDSAVLHSAALDLLARPHLTVEDYLSARYLLFQAPQNKKGSDAVTRTFIVTVGAVALPGAVPVLPEDVDLRCYVLGQSLCHP